MNTELHETKKKRGIKRLLKSFTYSWEGLVYAFKNEQNLTVHLLAVACVLLCGFYFHISRLEWMICIILFGLVIATELINTALEAAVDLFCPSYHPLAKIVKDTAASAVFVFALTAVIAGIMIFAPYIANLF